MFIAISFTIVDIKLYLCILVYIKPSLTSLNHFYYTLNEIDPYEFANDAIYALS